jgi:hypothetical protein
VPRPNRLPLALTKPPSKALIVRAVARAADVAPIVDNGTMSSDGRCRLRGGRSPGAPKGNKNAFRHGGYSAETIEARRKIATLLRTMRTLVERC